MGRSPFLRRFSASNQGGSALEFALVFPLLVVLMLGAVAIGQAFYGVAGTQWAIERAVRILMIDSQATHTDVEAEMRALLPGLRGLEVSISFADVGSGSLTATRVIADIAHPVEVPFIAQFDLRYRLETTAVRPF